MHACKGGNATFAWTFDLDPDESLEDLKWIYQAEGGPEQLVAMWALDTFLVLPAFEDRVLFVPNAGMVLLNADFTDSGSYTVDVSGLHGDASRQFFSHRVQATLTVGGA